MKSFDIKKVFKYKIKGDELFALLDNFWVKVNTATFFNIIDLPEILHNKKAEKGENGIKISLSGRLKGVRMARKFEEHEGVGLRTQSIEWAIEEEKRQILTKWGTIGLKVSRGGAKER